MEIDRSAPAIGSGESEIDAEPALVFSVMADLSGWPSWNPDVKSISVDGDVRPGTSFRWKAGGASLRSTLQVVDPPHEIGWTGTTMGIEAIHFFRFEPRGGGTLARSEESWSGLMPRLFRGFCRKAIDKAIAGGLASLKAEAERRAALA